MSFDEYEQETRKLYFGVSDNERSEARAKLQKSLSQIPQQSIKPNNSVIEMLTHLTTTQQLL